MSKAQPAAATWERIESLTPWDKNPRKSQPITEVAASIERFGFGAPVVARKADRSIIAGHTRVKAMDWMRGVVSTWEPDRLSALAGRLGCADAMESVIDALGMVPVRFVDVDADEAKALALADNRLGEMAEWDNESLASALDDLARMDFNLEALGWTAKESDSLRMLLDESGKGEQEQRMVHSGPPVSELGRVYQLGPHVLVCGSSSDVASWSALDTALAGRQYDLVWTDPPYGVSYASIGRSLATYSGVGDMAEQHAPIENDALTPEQLVPFLLSTLGPAYDRTAPGGAWYVAAPGRPAQHAFGTVLTGLPTLWRQSLVWLKDVFVFGRSDRHYRHETIFYGWKEGAGHVWTGGRKRDSVIEVPRPKVSNLHPTEKPVELIVECLMCHKQPGKIALVMDPFGGSGSTLIAAAQLGLACHTIELSPTYCDVIRARWGEWARAKGIDPGPDAL